MRSCGEGHVGLENFCGHMNVRKPMRKNNYTKLSHRIRDSAKNVAERSMAIAAADVKRFEGNSDVGVSIDGTWQKREFSSLNGVVAAISITNGKILDLEAITRYCNVCETLFLFIINLFILGENSKI